MGIITTMRNRGGLVAGAIGFAIVAFLVGDVLISGRSFFNSSRTEIGSINQESIDYRDFDAKLQKSMENFRNQQQQTKIDDNIQGYLNDQTWNQLVQEIIMTKQYDKTGINVSSDELFDMIQGKNPHPEIKKTFVNQAGIFDRNLVINFLQTMDERDPSGKTREQWINFEKSLKEDRIRQKYFNLIKNGLYVTTAMAKKDYADRSGNADFRYVMMDYFSVPDSTVKISEDDIQTYYKENSYKYKQKEDTRSFEYISYDVNPSPEDTASVRKWITEKADYIRTHQDDSIYISLNTENKFTGAYSKKGTISPLLDTNLFNASKGTVFGPYIEGGFYKVAKLMDVKMIPDSVKARHILIKVDAGKLAAAKKQADSLKKVIETGADFATLAKTYSADKGSAELGGELGYFTQGRMVKPFENACFFGKKGEVTVVESQFGYHIIQIEDQKNMNKQVQIGVIDRKIEPSATTVQAGYAKINALRANINNAKDFEAVTLSTGFGKRVSDNVKANDHFLPGLESPKEVIRWAYKADKDDISPVFQLGNKFIFAHLSAIKDKGITPLEYVKKEVEAEAKKQKKQDMLKEKMAKAAEGNASIEAIAQKLNLRVDTARGVNFMMAMIPGISREPEVSGTAFGLGKGKVSKPVAGQRGVYMIYVDAITEPAPQKDFTMNRMQLAGNMKSRIDYEALEALKDKASIKDYRYKFY